jgi:hypothetical protein
MINIPLFGSDKELNTFVDDYSKKNSITIDNRDFFFAVAIDNGKERKLFTKSGIEDLVIEDDLFEWYTKGYIRLRNDEDDMERSLGPDKILSMLRLSKTYKMRGDGRDIISVNITPNLQTLRTWIARVAGIEQKPDEDIFKYSNDFSVYDVKTEYEGRQQYKVLYFWDLRYQLLLERNVHYSTALVKKKQEKQFEKKIRVVNNKDREVLTGEAIQEFIKQALEDQKPEFEDELWDKGGAKVFYSSPAQYKGLNDLDYLMTSHVSDDEGDNDFSILKYDTYLKKWTLMSISKYFSKALDGEEAGEYQFDKFQISQHAGPLGFLGPLASFLTSNKAPNLKLGDLNSKVKSIKVPIPKIGQTQRKNMIPGESMELEPDSWKFEDFAGIDNQSLLTTYAVHSYNTNTHEFNIDVFDNEIRTVSEKFQEHYLDGKFIGDPDPALNFQLTKGKKEQKVLNNLFTLDQDEKARAIKGRNQLFKNLIFLNNAVSLNVKGDTHRRTGRFFSLDRKDPYFPNEFDDKILGQYFIVNVKHIISKETYSNEMLGVKPYRYKAPAFETDKVHE